LIESKYVHDDLGTQRGKLFWIDGWIQMANARLKYVTFQIWDATHRSGAHFGPINRQVATQEEEPENLAKDGYTRNADYCTHIRTPS
jgi:hypothetical protein